MSERRDGDADGGPEREVGGERVQWRSSVPEAPATEEDIEHFKDTVLNKLMLAVGKDPSSATDRDWFVATTLSLRDRVIHRWLRSIARTSPRRKQITTCRNF